MGLYESRNNTVETIMQSGQGQEFWNGYFAAEADNYSKILSDTSVVYSGKLSELAQQFDMEPITFIGFLDGINTSLKAELDLDSLTEDSEITLDIDYEKLFYNMHIAKASWLYEMKEWDNVLSKEKRAEIYAQYRNDVIAHSDKVGRNDPCPCGSGKKYKNCCLK